MRLFWVGLRPEETEAVGDGNFLAKKTGHRDGITAAMFYGVGVARQLTGTEFPVLLNLALPRKLDLLLL